ncbi:MAG: thioredoxin family protein [Chthoniobacteraceae bacterium]
MKTIPALLAILVLSAQVVFAAVKPGDTAPDFKLTDIHGKSHSLTEFKGKPVVLEWVNYGCPFVGKQYNSKNMQTLQQEYTAKGVVWLSINSSAPGKQGNMSAEEWQKAVTEKGAHPTAVLLDSDGKVGHLYGAKTTPDMWVINSNGKVVYTGAIDSIASTDVADVPKATNYVKEALDATMAGKTVPTAETRSYGCSVKYE